MAQSATKSRRLVMTFIAYAFALMLFFPILWMVITSFKSEADAIALPPKFLFFHWTLANYIAVQARNNYWGFAFNSIVLSFGSTLAGLIIGIPAAYAFAFAPTKNTKQILLWMLSTKMMPAVGVLVPIYLILLKVHLLDTFTGLIIILFLSNLPIMIWMLYTYFKEIPHEILEASRMDGASRWKEIVYVLSPMAVPGIASTVLLNIILSWNETFWSLNVTNIHAAPLTAFIASYSSPEGLFWAKLSAASTLAVAPIVLLGWFSQRQLVRGLTFGAVK